MPFMHALPTLNYWYLEEVARQCHDELHDFARRICRRHDILDFVQDAVSTAHLRLIGADIIADEDRDVVRYLMTLIRHICVDERRRRNRQCWQTTVHQESDGATHWDLLLPLLPNSMVGVIDDSVELIHRREQVMCLREAQKYLPGAVIKTHPTLASDLERGFASIFNIQALTTRQAQRERQRRLRLRTLLAGWFHRHFGDRPYDLTDKRTERYWNLGFELASQYLQEKECRV